MLEYYFNWAAIAS